MPALTRRRFTQLAAVALPQILVRPPARAQADVGRLGGRGVAYTRYNLVPPREYRFTTTYSF
jgi:hypothetical protein